MRFWFRTWHGLLIIIGIFAFADSAFAYATGGLLVSENLLASEGANRRVISFTYNASSIPENTNLRASFSRTGSGCDWYNSSDELYEWDTLEEGTNTLYFTDAKFKDTSNFYYRVYFTSSGANTPVLDSVSIDYDTNTWQYDTYNSTGTLLSRNLLPSVSVDNFSGVSATVSVLPSQNNLQIQFSSDNSTWYDSAGTQDASDSLSEGSNTIDISGLGWSSDSFYYRINYSSSGSTTSTLDDVTLTLDTSAGTVTYTGTGSYTGLELGDSYNNLAFTGTGAWALDAALNVDGTFTISNGTLAQGTNQMNIAGNTIIGSNSTFTKSSNGSLFILDGDLTLENEAGANLGNVQIGASPDTTTLSGALIADSLTIGSGDTLITDGYNVIVGMGGITNSGTIVASGGAGGTTSISTASGFVNHGTYTSGDSIFTLSGSFINKGTFTANTGSVILDGANQALSGSTTFYNFTKTVTSADTLTFTAGDTFTISNTLTLQGAASNLLSLRSSTSGTRWNINPQGTRTISYLDVKDSSNSNSTSIDATDGTHTDSGNNTSWNFPSDEEEEENAENDTTSTASSGGGGGSRGGRDSPGMQSRIADAHTRILALLERRRGGGEQVFAWNEEPAVSNNSEQDGTESEEDSEKKLQAPAYPQRPTPEQIARKRERLFAMVGNTPVIYGDVMLNEWYTPFVSYVVEEKIATGYADEEGKPKGEFGIANPVTVAELLKMALEASGADLKITQPPRNASARGTWASTYIAKGESLQLSILTGERNVHEPATRAEVVQTITEVMNFPLLPAWTDRFTDVPHDHKNARAIATATAYEIIKGDTDENGNPTGMFRPDAPINRAEASKIIALIKEAFR